MSSKKSKKSIDSSLLLRGFELMCTAKSLAELYEANFKKVSKYVHATSRGHEAIQLATALQLRPEDYAFPYYRDDAFLLGIGMTPKDLMLQLLAKQDDPFSGGRSYYSHPSLRDDDKVKIPHQSSATGMQAIPATGTAMGIQYKELKDLAMEGAPLVVCSLGDASITEGEVSEAFQMAALRQLPILYLIQDNEWDISASADEIRAQDANEFIKGFKGIKHKSIDGTDFAECWEAAETALNYIRKHRKPYLLHAKVPLLNHHTSGVRMEWYRDDLEEDLKMDPYPRLKKDLQKQGINSSEIESIEERIRNYVQNEFEAAQAMPDPEPNQIYNHIFAPSPVDEEVGQRIGNSNDETVMVDCALHAIEELMHKHEECLLYGQDVGHRLGGVFREAATLAQKFGNERVFNTPIQEAYIVGSTVGMSAVGLKPIVEVQFADYIWPGLNQLFTEVSRSNYLSYGKWPVSMILRVPCGAYGSGGPYHSSSVESVVTNIIGVKVIYPSNGADLKGLLKAAYYDPNPVVCFEHKGLYWSKVPGTDAARVKEPDQEYILPLGKARVVQSAKEEIIESGNSLCIISYGMGVHWALNAAKDFNGQVTIVDLRTLVPLDKDLIFEQCRRHGKCLVVTEEPEKAGFARSISSMIQENCFEYLDAPVTVLGAENLPAIPIHSDLEKAALPNAEKLKSKIRLILDY